MKPKPPSSPAIKIKRPKKPGPQPREATLLPGMAIPPDPILLPGDGIPIEGLKAWHCRAVIGRKDGQAMFCGNVVIRPSCAWCSHHYAIYYRPATSSSRV